MAKQFMGIGRTASCRYLSRIVSLKNMPAYNLELTYNIITIVYLTVREKEIPRY